MGPLSNNNRRVVSVSGGHGTDIVGCLLRSLAKYQSIATIVDFSLSRLHHNLTFSVLLSFSASLQPMLDDLHVSASQWDASVQVIDVESVGSLEDAPYSGRVKYAATVLDQNGLSISFLSAWTDFLLVKGISIEKMVKLTKSSSPLVCIDYRLSVPAHVDVNQLFKEELFQLTADYGTDVALQPDNVFRRNKRLVVFDMDSTLVQQEVIDEIADRAGIVDQVGAITSLAMNGQIDFAESLRRRVQLLAGVPVSVIDQVRDALVFTEGAHFLCASLKRLGFKLAVISGGFLPLAKYVQSTLNLDYAFANQLKLSADCTTLTGETIGPIVDAVRKAELLEVIAQAESISLDQVIAIGDGANDLLMLSRASLGIAFNAKAIVQQNAKARINQKSLKYVLYLLGYSEEDALQLATSSHPAT